MELTLLFSMKWKIFLFIMYRTQEKAMQITRVQEILRFCSSCTPSEYKRTSGSVQVVPHQSTRYPEVLFKLYPTRVQENRWICSSCTPPEYKKTGGSILVIYLTRVQENRWIYSSRIPHQRTREPVDLF